MLGPYPEFATLHDAFRPQILRYVTSLVGERDAEDVTQEVLAKVSEGLEQFRGEAAPSTWIFRIATNAALDRLRSPRVRQAALEVSTSPSGSDGAAGRALIDRLPDEHTPSAETLVIRQQMNDCIRQFIDDLPDNYRVIILLSDLEGFKNGEIAGILGVSLSAVKIRLHRARKELKKKLEVGCDFYRGERNEIACDRKAAPAASSR